MNGEDRRTRLAKLHEERMSWQPAKKSLGGRSLDRWSRFLANFGWERLFFAGGVVLIAALAIGALYIFASNAFNDDGKKQVSAGSSRPTATKTRSGPTALPTAIVIGVPTLPTALPPKDRADCELIRGTEYTSETERQWFEQNCLPTPVPQPTDRPSNGGGDEPTDVPPPTEPPPGPSATPDTFTSEDAIDVGVYWMEHNAPQHYQVNRGTCNSFDSGNHWVVTCVANANGGSSTVSVCVYAEPLVVRPSNQC